MEFGANIQVKACRVINISIYVCLLWEILDQNRKKGERSFYGPWPYKCKYDRVQKLNDDKNDVWSLNFMVFNDEE